MGWRDRLIRWLDPMRRDRERLNVQPSGAIEFIPAGCAQMICCPQCGVWSDPEVQRSPCGFSFEDMMHYDENGQGWETGMCLDCGHGPACHPGWEGEDYGRAG